MSFLRIAPAAYRQTSISVFKKLLAVMAGVLAFYGLRGMENLQSNYESKRSEPIVVVDSPGSIGNEYAIALVREHLDADFKPVTHQLDEKLEALKKDAASDAGLTESVKTLGQLISDSAIRDVRIQSRKNPFANGAEIIRFLSERITAAETEAQTSLLKQQQQRLVQIEGLRIKFSDQPGEFRSRFGLGDGDDSQLKQAFDDEVRTQPVVDTSKKRDERIKSTNALAGFARSAVDNRAAANKLAIAELTYQVRGELVSSFAPSLTRYINERRNASPHPNLVSEMILDRQRTTYVIYQVIELTFIAILVFGLLFPIYLLFRTLPPFTSSLEPLGDRAKRLLSREGMATIAAPEIAKTAVLSLAAIGIGAAVVIANNPPSRDPGLAPGVDIADTRYHPPSKPSPKSSPGSTPAVETISPTPTPTPDAGGVTPAPSPVINVYPQFFPTISTNEGRLHTLEALNAGPRLDKIDGQLREKADSSQIKDFVTSTQVNDRIRASETSLGGEIKGVKDVVTALNEKTIQDINATITNKSAELSGRINATNSALSAYREGTQGRSVSSRIKEVFGKEKYLVTRQNLDILHQLMCPQMCGPGTIEDNLINNLQRLEREGKEMSKKDLQTRLALGRGGPTARWEPVILRYTRSTY